jgi:hypothetical protein
LTTVFRFLSRRLVVSIALLIVFMLSALLAIMFVLRSKHSIVIKSTIVVATLLFAVLAYLLGSTSPISPFSRPSWISF